MRADHVMHVPCRKRTEPACRACATDCCAKTLAKQFTETRTSKTPASISHPASPSVTQLTRPPQPSRCLRKRATAVSRRRDEISYTHTDCSPVYVKGRHISYQRSKRNSNPNVSLLQLEGVENTKDAQWYLGKRVAYVYRVGSSKSNPVRVIWGKIRRTHGAYIFFRPRQAE